MPEPGRGVAQSSPRHPTSFLCLMGAGLTVVYRPPPFRNDFRPCCTAMLCPLANKSRVSRSDQLRTPLSVVALRCSPWLEAVEEDACLLPPGTTLCSAEGLGVGGGGELLSQPPDHSQKSCGDFLGVLLPHSEIGLVPPRVWIHVSLTGFAPEWEVRSGATEGLWSRLKRTQVLCWRLASSPS